MSHIDKLIADLCPNGVEFRTMKSLAKRSKGTSITAARMKSLSRPSGEIRIFAGGKTFADVDATAIPTGDVITTPSIIVRSRGNIDFTYYDKPFTHKSEMWSYSTSRPDVEQRFVYYYLTTLTSRLQEVARATSVKLPQLKVKDTDLLRVPIPPLEVQREIVRVLDKFTQLEAELEAELEARQQQYENYLDRLISFRGENEASWTPIGDLGVIFRGKRFTKSDYVDSGGIGVIHYGEIYTRYGTTANQAVSQVRSNLGPALRYARKGDVILTDVGETVEDVGKAMAWLGEEPVAVHDHCYVIRSELDAAYLAYAMQGNDFRKAKEQAIARTKVKTLLLDGLKRIKVPIPPLEEQRRIVSILDRFDSLVNDLSVGLPAELAARRKQYEYYRDRLLTFEEKR